MSLKNTNTYRTSTKVLTEFAADLLQLVLLERLIDWSGATPEDVGFGGEETVEVQSLASLGRRCQAACSLASAFLLKAVVVFLFSKSLQKHRKRIQEYSFILFIAYDLYYEIRNVRGLMRAPMNQKRCPSQIAEGGWEIPKQATNLLTRQRKHHVL